MRWSGKSRLIDNGGAAKLHTKQHAIVVGAGVGGLMTALALQHCGMKVSVYERSPDIQRGGAALTLWSNATRIIAQYGVLERILPLCKPIAEGKIETAEGECLATIPCKAMAERYGAPILCVLRATLLEALYEAVGQHNVHFNKTCVDVTQTAATVTVMFEHAPEVTGDVLIACDGIHSAVRARIRRSAETMRYSGYTAWRGIAPLSLDLNAKAQMLEIWGRGARFGIAPISDTQLYWFATENAAPNQTSEDGEKAHLLRFAKAFTSPVAMVVAATPETHILRNDVYDRKPLVTWVDGRIALLGDAAHAATPNLGQGACMAIEDAAVLAYCMASSRQADIGKTLRRYESIRRKRANRIVRLSWRVGQVGQLARPQTVWTRNQLVKHVPQWFQRRSFNSIAGYQTPNATASRTHRSSGVE